jgi:hypothetical protein
LTTDITINRRDYRMLIFEVETAFTLQSRKPAYPVFQLAKLPRAYRYHGIQIENRKAEMDESTPDLAP